MSVAKLKRKAIELFEEFTGHTGEVVGKAKIPEPPKYLVKIGSVEAIGYKATRDGHTERYLHEFKSRSAPILCASPDGKQLYIIGGRYEFTEAGIVDK